MNKALFTLLSSILLININIFAQLADKEPDHIYAMIFTDQIVPALGNYPFYKDGGVIKKDLRAVISRPLFVGQYKGYSINLKSSMIQYPELKDASRTNSFNGIFKQDPIKRVDFQKLSIQGKKSFADLANKYGVLRMVIGDYNNAEKYLIKGQELRKELFGTRSLSYLNSLFNIGVLRVQQGDYRNAQNILNYFEKIADVIFKDEQANKAVLYNNLAMLYANIGQVDKAFETIDKAIELGKLHFKDEYIEMERIIANKALLFETKGELDKTKKLYQEAIEGMTLKEFQRHPDLLNIRAQLGKVLIRLNTSDALSYNQETTQQAKREFNENHPLYAVSLNNEALYYLKNNDFQQAREIFTQVAEIRLNAFGPLHPDYLETISSIALAQWKEGNIEEANKNFNKSIGSYMSLVEKSFGGMNESEKSDFWTMLKPKLDAYYSFVIQNGPENEELLSKAYQYRVSTKGLLLSSTTKIKSLVSNIDDQQLKELYQEWVEVKEKLAFYYNSPSEVAKEENVDIDDLELYAEDLERQINLKSSVLSTVQTNGLTLTELLELLQPNEAAFEIIRVKDEWSTENTQILYLALIADGKSKSVKMAINQNGADLESKFSRLYKNSIKFKMKETNTYEAFWQPFDEATSAFDKLYLSVDGVYNTINIKSLYDGTDYMIDKKDMVIVSNTQFIGKITSSEDNFSTASSVLIGFPEFGNEEIVKSLPGTKIEVQKIDSILRKNDVESQLFLSDQANKANLFGISSPKILHIATHGYFLEDIKSSDEVFMGVQVSKARNNPLLRSGLLLSGASQSMDASAPPTAGNQGIVNAYEIMNLDLSNTSMVVLSACETGTGEVVNGEGVYGLPRAFQVAGAKVIIMSLWKVDDAATQKLMTKFYDHFVINKDINKAFMSAQLELKEEYSDPYYWSAFVLLN